MSGPSCQIVILISLSAVFLGSPFPSTPTSIFFMVSNYNLAVEEAQIFSPPQSLPWSLDSSIYVPAAQVLDMDALLVSWKCLTSFNT